jgi:hypothetical protein
LGIENDMMGGFDGTQGIIGLFTLLQAPRSSTRLNLIEQKGYADSVMRHDIVSIALNGP